MPAIFKQNVNQWLCIALLGLMCFWVVLYYLSNKAYLIGTAIATNSEETRN